MDERFQQLRQPLDRASNESPEPDPDPVRTLVLVDDEDESRKVFGELLRDEGFDIVAEAANGKEALEQLRALPVLPDAVVTNYQMPEMRGTELAAHMDSDSRLSAVPILLFSGHPESFIRKIDRQGIGSNVTAFVKLPASLNEFLATIRTLRRRQRADRQRPHIAHERSW